VGEIGPCEPNPAPKSLAERQALDDDGRHRETEEGEPGERDEVDPLEHGDPRDGNRPEREDAGEHGRAERSAASGRHPDRAHVGRPEDERADDDPVAELHAPVQKRGSDRVRGRGKAEREGAPEAPSVQLDRLGDELTDSALVRRDGDLTGDVHEGTLPRPYPSASTSSS
jgi:hypothetical protein